MISIFAFVDLNDIDNSGQKFCANCYIVNFLTHFKLRDDWSNLKSCSIKKYVRTSEDICRGGVFLVRSQYHRKFLNKTRQQPFI